MLLEESAAIAVDETSSAEAGAGMAIARPSASAIPNKTARMSLPPEPHNAAHERSRCKISSG
jgi:hypothetical protein